jgi:hypothetical protein
MNEKSQFDTGLPPAGTCLRCGAAWLGRPGGRPRKWCSQRCRRAAYEERRAAAEGAIAVREVVREVVREAPEQEHDLTTCAGRVADSPAAARRVIRSLDKLVQASSDPRWSSIREDLLRLAARIQAEDHRKTRWQRR